MLYCSQESSIAKIEVTALLFFVFFCAFFALFGGFFFGERCGSDLSRFFELCQCLKSSAFPEVIIFALVGQYMPVATQRK
ncbi:hypothetical protein PIB30_059925 [Stylosanthes scabra]|uniref:Uncharacterized protein n=1 Tax=Stylosanthes scabra TaxID=79078 RepID=A0ABU6UKY2_9FABA|nr:hypothetical protein [Stylosanthes scabra]